MDLLPEKFTSNCISMKNEIKFISNGMAIQLPPYIR